MVGVVNDVGIGIVCGDIQCMNSAVDQLGTELGRAIAHEAIQHLAAAHADVLIFFLDVDIDLNIRGRYHLHLADAAVNDFWRQIEFAHHAKRDCSATRLCII